MLMHHSDTGLQRRLRRSRHKRLTFDFDAAGVSNVVSEEYVHQGGFAGPILAQ